MEWIETNGVVLRYELSGVGRIPLLLMHELGGSLEFWDPVLPAFQPAFRVLRYDLRGCGMSENAMFPGAKLARYWRCAALVQDPV